VELASLHPASVIAMSTAARRRGRQRELRYIDYLRERGWVALRVDGSGDIVAGKDGITLLIQVKSTTDGPYKTFGPAERQRIIEDADRAGWFAALLWWPPGRGVQDAELIPESDWPKLKLAA
jgi:Holliday junction resolvase